MIFQIHLEIYKRLNMNLIWQSIFLWMELRTTKNNLEDDVRKLTILYEMYAQSIVGQALRQLILTKMFIIERSPYSWDKLLAVGRGQNNFLLLGIFYFTHTVNVIHAFSMLNNHFDTSGCVRKRMQKSDFSFVIQLTIAYINNITF